MTDKSDRSRKGLVLAALLLHSSTLFAAGLVVFGEKDFSVVGGSKASAPSDPYRHSFYDAVAKNLMRGPAFESALSLVSPPAWGKTIGPSTRGTIRLHTSFKGGMVCEIALENLLPDHDYILTLNGNPSLAGNSLLLSPVPGNPSERYYDFAVARTDETGRFKSTYGIFLKPGAYAVRCYVKDTGDFKIVLYHDYFPFLVE